MNYLVIHTECILFYSKLQCKESWAPKNWCFWIVVLEKTLESPLDIKEIQPVHPKRNQSWIFIRRTDVEAETPVLWLPQELTHWKRPWCWERLKAGGEGVDRGWDGQMASLTQWTWVWVNSGSWWLTGRPGVLQSKRLPRVKHDWVTDWIETPVWTLFPLPLFFFLVCLFACFKLKITVLYCEFVQAVVTITMIQTVLFFVFIPSFVWPFFQGGCVQGLFCANLARYWDVTWPRESQPSQSFWSTAACDGCHMRLVLKGSVSRRERETNLIRFGKKSLRMALNAETGRIQWDFAMTLIHGIPSLRLLSWYSYFPCSTSLNFLHAQIILSFFFCICKLCQGTGLFDHFWPTNVAISNHSTNICDAVRPNAVVS